MKKYIIIILLLNSYLSLYSNITDFSKDSNQLTAKNYIKEGNPYFEQDDIKKAIEQYKNAFSLSQETNNLELQKESSQQLSLCYKELNQFKDALYFQKLNSTLSDSLLRISINQTISNLEEKFESEKKEKHIANQTAMISNKELKLKQRNYFIYSIIAFGIVLLIIGFFIIRNLRFSQKRLIEEKQIKAEINKLKELNKLNEERLRISKDLHDNIGSQLTFIISAIDNTSFLIKDSTEDEIKNKLEDLNQFSKKAIKELREAINQLNDK